MQLLAKKTLPARWHASQTYGRRARRWEFDRSAAVVESSFHERCAPLHGKLFRHTDRPTCYCVTRANGCASPLLAAPDRAICGNDPVPPAAPGRHQFFPVIYFPTGSNNWPLRKVRHYQKALRVPIFLNDIQINIYGAQKGAAPAQSDYVKPEIQSTYGQLRTAIWYQKRKRHRAKCLMDAVFGENRAQHAFKWPIGLLGQLTAAECFCGPSIQFD